MAWLHGAPLLEYTLAHVRTDAGKTHTHVASLLWPSAWMHHASVTRRRCGWVVISVAEESEVDKIRTDRTGMRGSTLDICWKPVRRPPIHSLTALRVQGARERYWGYLFPNGRFSVQVRRVTWFRERRGEKRPGHECPERWLVSDAGCFSCSAWLRLDGCCR